MKKFLNIKYGLGLLLGASFMVQSCDTEEINNLQTAANGEIGTYARLVSITDNTFDYLVPETSKFDMSVEFIDDKFGAEVVAYEVYARFADLTLESENSPNYSIDEVMIVTQEANEFNTSTNGYAGASYTITAPEVISALGLDWNNVSPGDAIIYRSQVTLSDGRIFTSTNTGASILSELYYNDAFEFRSNIACATEETFAVGSYSMTVSGAGGFGNFANDGTVTLVANNSTSRSFDFTWLPDIGGFAQTLDFDLICANATVVNHNTGLGCGGGGIEWDDSSLSEGSYTIGDDSTIVLKLEDFTFDAGCGINKYEVTITLTKL